MKFFTIIFFILSMFSGIYAQSPGMEWEQLFGGFENDIAKSVIQASDGSLYVCGSTESMGAGKSDAYIIHLDAAGKEIWQKTYGGEAEDVANCIIQVKDGNLVFCGSTESKGKGKEDFWICKIDENGKILWEKTHGGDKTDVANWIIQTYDNGFAVSGYTKSRGDGGYDAFIMKLDENGERVWRKTYGGSSRDAAEKIIQTPDSGFVFCGYSASKSAGSYDFWICKIDMKGKDIWEKKFGDLTMEVAYSLSRLMDESYMVCGYELDKKNQNYNIWLMHLDQYGEKLWEKRYGENRMEQGYKIIPTSDGNYAICGYTSSIGNGKKDMWILKVDKKGNLLWDVPFGGENDEVANDIIETSDGGFVICGSNSSAGEGKDDVYVIKYKGK